MGTEISATSFSHSQRSRYRELLESQLERLRDLTERDIFDDTLALGLELELNLSDTAGDPALINDEVLAGLAARELPEAAAGGDFVAELGRFTIELNHPVVEIGGTGLQKLESSLTQSLALATEEAARHGARITPVGVLPSLLGEHLSGMDWISTGARFESLNDAIMTARGEEILCDITGEEHLSFYSPTIAIESACTSMQLHVEVTRDRFGPVWNAAQAIAGPQIALAANSPFFLGSRLWHETRIPLFQQAIDDRAPEYARQGVRPRVWFGEEWVESIADLYAENIAYFPSLIPEMSEGEPETTALGAPILAELNLHNGTVYRWNRPIYDPGSDTRPANLRVENRLLPAGPTPVDMVANTAFFFGLIRGIVDTGDNPWERMSFGAARSNFYACAKHGLGAEVYWPGYGELPVTELLDRYLIPLAGRGLDMLEVEPGISTRLLSVLTGRLRSGMTGAAWQRKALTRLEGETGVGARQDALRELTVRYTEYATAGDPVHTWPLP